MLSLLSIAIIIISLVLWLLFHHSVYRYLYIYTDVRKKSQFMAKHFPVPYILFPASFFLLPLFLANIPPSIILYSSPVFISTLPFFSLPLFPFSFSSILSLLPCTFPSLLLPLSFHFRSLCCLPAASLLSSLSVHPLFPSLLLLPAFLNTLNVPLPPLSLMAQTSFPPPTPLTLFPTYLPSLHRFPFLIFPFFLLHSSLPTSFALPSTYRSV